ncbi:MAG: VOC family protein [Bryobacterales bacterium]|nr:VOC family protein [Bryobacterales bacterium]
MTRQSFLRAMQWMPERSFRNRLRKELEMSAHEMVKSPAPAGFTAVTAYPVLPRGTAEAFLTFVEQAFGAENTMRVPRPDGSLMHAEIRMSGCVLECGESNEQFAPAPVCLHYYVPDVDAAYQAALKAGAESLYEPTSRPYGDREAGVRDVAGNSWFLATHQGEHYIMEPLRSLTPYIMANGAARLIEFLKEGLGAEAIYVGSSPEGRIPHAKIRIGDTVLEFSDASPQWPATPVGLHYYVEDADAACERAVAAGGELISPPRDQPYGERSGTVKDPSGNSWYIAQLLQPR